MSSAVLDLAIAFLAGVGLGCVYFLGLWWTVRNLPFAHRPALLSLGSLILRMGLVLTGFYFVMDGRWEMLLACLSGFIAVRGLLVRRLGPERQYNGKKAVRP